MKKTKVKSQNVLTGALILLLATVAVKLIGAFFKIPLTNLIGGTGMGYFMTAYGMFNPIYSLSIAGMPVAVSRLVAENMAMQRYRDVKKLMKAARLLFFAAGTVGCLVMLFGSGLFVEAVGNPYALYPVMAMAPAVFFGCMMSAYRGYYEGMRNMNPTALSQVIEAVVKLLFGYLAAKWILASASAQYAQSGTVFWITPASAEEAHNLILSFSATGAMLGVTASCAAGMAFVVLRHLIIGDGISKQQLLLAPAPASGGELLKKLARIAIPVCIASVVTSLTSLIDLGSVMNRLSTALSRDSVTMLSGYAGAIPTDMALADIPNYLYGSYRLVL